MTFNPEFNEDGDLLEVTKLVPMDLAPESPLFIIETDRGNIPCSSPEQLIFDKHLPPAFDGFTTCRVTMDGNQIFKLPHHDVTWERFQTEMINKSPVFLRALVARVAR